MSKLRKSLLLLSLSAMAVCGLAAVSFRKANEVNAYYTPSTTYEVEDPSKYYAGIDSTKSGTDLLSDLRSLNVGKRRSHMSYDSMGTSTSDSVYIYTDYDPKTVKYDSNGQPYGTSILSFYSGISTTSWNREHVWPNSRGGGSKGSASGEHPDQDIFMPRPTISSENSDRGNSCYVEGMAHSQNGWDPVTAFGDNIGVYESIRGESARIVFYCMTLNPNLVLVDNADTSNSTKTKMGKLSDLLKWNIENPVNEREINRNSGGQYLQGNRNAFVDHPEYACKIWGNTNDATRKICASEKTVTSLTYSGTLKTTTFYEHSSFNPEGLTITATYNDESTENVTSQVTWSELVAGNTSVTGSFGGQTITITGLTILEPSGNVEGVSLDKNSATIKVGATLQLTPTITPSYAKNKNVSWFSSSSSVATVNSNGLVTGVSEGTATITVRTEDGNFTATCTVTVSGSQDDVYNVEITRNSFAQAGSYNWYGWSQNDVTGKAYMYTSEKSKMQFNGNKTGKALFSDTSKGTIKSITVKSQTNSPKWTLYTSNTPYSENTVKSGTSQGQKATSTSGVKWELSNTDRYFSLNLDESGAAYLSSIIVEYDSGVVPPTPTPKVNSIDLPSTLSINKSTSSTGTITPIVDADEGASYTINWSSSDESIATVNGDNNSATVTALKTGSVSITASIGSYSANCVVTITENIEPTRKLVEIAVTSKPDKTTYSVGESFDASGLSVGANYLDGSSIDITNEVEFDEPDTSSEGTKTIFVTYNETFTTTFDIIVLKDEVSDLIIEKYPLKTHYFESEEFSPLGMVVTAKIGGNTQDVTNLVEYEYDFSLVAQVKVKFEDLYEDFFVTIESGEITDEHKAADFAYIVEDKVQDVSVDNVTLSDWEVLEHYYNALDEDAQKVLQETVTQYVNGVSAGEELSDTLMECVSKYDEIYLAHKDEGFTDFMSRNPKAPSPTPTPTPKSNVVDLMKTLKAAGIVLGIIVLIVLIIVISVVASKKSKKKHA